MAGRDKEVKELIDLVKKQKDKSGKHYKVVTSGGGHYKVLDGAGRVIIPQDNGGPLLISSSPSDFRWRDLCVARMIRAGIFKSNPYSTKDQKKDPKEAVNREDEFEEKQARRLAEIAQNQGRQAQTDQLRSRVEPFIVKIGGSWSKRGFAREFADVAYFMLKRKNHEDCWPSEDAARTNVKILAAGNTLSERYNRAWNAVMDELESQETPKQYYFDMVREARGIPARRLRNEAMAQKMTVVDPGNDRVLPLPEFFPDPVPEPDFNGDQPKLVQPLVDAHYLSGLRWAVEFNLQEFVEAQRALGFFEAAVEQNFGEAGKEALERMHKLLDKIGEYRFYKSVGRA